MNRYGLAKYDGNEGGMSVIWEMGHRTIAGFIKEKGLEPVPRKRLPIIEGSSPRVPPFPGGWRSAHLHFDGDIYLLDHKQWREFSKARLEEFSHQLENTRTISFENFVEVGEALAAASPALGMSLSKGS